MFNDNFLEHQEIVDELVLAFEDKEDGIESIIEKLVSKNS
jgi:hypothetical protein